MKVTPAQLNVLKKLTKPHKEVVKEHPIDAYNSRTIGSLLRRGLVEKVTHKLFLHGAVQLTDRGREVVEESVVKKKEKYWYAYTLRGCSLGCQPRGFVGTDDTYGRFGAVVYDRELTEEEVNRYELQELEKEV